MAAESTENGSTTVAQGSDSSTVKVEDIQPPPASDTSPAAEANPTAATPAEKKWPGWPGDSVYRLVVPVAKVGSIIGRKGELIKKMCEETRSRIRVLDGANGTNDRIVLISGKEEPEVPISPAMSGVLRVFRRISGLPESEGEGIGASAAGGAACSVRLLVASSQAINLIGKQGTLIKSIQESSGASVRVLSGEELPFYANSDERIVDIQGEAVKVLKALEAVVGHLRKFLVDHSIIPLFEKVSNTTSSQSQDLVVDSWVEKSQPSMLHTVPQTGFNSDYSLSLKRESLYLDRETQPESHVPHSGLSLYGQDPSISGMRPSGLARPSAPIVTQMTQTMQIPLSYAEDIIGIGGTNIAYIRRTSGAILTVQESRGLPEEITVEIKGSSSQVMQAQQLIQEFLGGHKDPIPSSYGKMDSSGLRSYSQIGNIGNTSYTSSAYGSQGLGGYGSSGLGGYSSYRPL